LQSYKVYKNEKRLFSSPDSNGILFYLLPEVLEGNK